LSSYCELREASLSESPPKGWLTPEYSHRREYNRTIFFLVLSLNSYKRWSHPLRRM